MLHEQLAVDLVEALELRDPALTVAASPAARPLAAWAPRFDPDDQQLASDADRKVIRAAGGSAFSYRFERVPPGARLLARTLVYSPHRHEPEKADPWPVRFVVRAGERILAELSSDYILEPRSHVFDQVLRTLEVDLAEWEGESLELDFEVLEGEPPPAGAAIPETGWWELRVMRTLELPRQRASSDRPNLLVLCVDTLAGGRTSLLGHERPTTPQLSALAARGTLFERAWSPSSWTLPSTASLFTGLPPNTHGVLGDDRSYLMEGLQTFAESLRAVGIEGAAFVGNPLLTRFNNYHQGFSRWETRAEIEGRQVDAPELYADFLAWLDEQPAGARWFGYVHTMDPHAPYGAPDDARERFVPPGLEAETDFTRFLPLHLHEPDRAPLSANDQRFVGALYEGEVAFADAALGALVSALEARGLLGDTVIVITADHGEELFEHGKLGHGYALNEPMLHVPLLMFGPHVPVGRRVTAPVNTASLAATLLALGGVAPRAEQAPSLLPLRAEPATEPVFALTRTHLFGPKRVLVSALASDGRKVVVELDAEELPFALEAYDLPASGEARVDLRALSAEERAGYEALADAAVEWAAESAAARPAESTSLTPEAQRAQEEALRDVGYIAGSEDDDQ